MEQTTSKDEGFGSLYTEVRINTHLVLLFLKLVVFPAAAAESDVGVGGMSSSLAALARLA